MRLGQIDATLKSDGQPLQEYQTETTRTGMPERGVSTCWVSSNQGKPFEVQVLGAEHVSILLTLLADGEVLDRRLADHMDDVLLSGNRYGRKEKGSFLFAPPGWTPIEEYDEDERDMTNPEKWIKMGTITLELYHVTMIYGPPNSADAFYFEPNPEELHTVTIGPKIKSRKREEPLERRVDYTFNEPWGRKPFHTFHFKHRPQDWLEKYGIVPRPLLWELESLSLNRPPTPTYVQDMSDLSLMDIDED